MFPSSFLTLFTSFLTFSTLSAYSTTSFSPSRRIPCTHLHLFRRVSNVPIPPPPPVPAPTLLDIGSVLSSEKLITIATENHILPEFLLKLYATIPFGMRKVLNSLYPMDLLFFFLFQLTYRKVLRYTHKLQIIIWKMFSLGTPLPFKDSILGFIEERNAVLAKLMGFNYIGTIKQFFSFLKPIIMYYNL